MKKLVLGYLPDNYDRETHIILGPWSYLNKQDLLFNGSDLFESDPYIDNINLKRDADISSKISVELINIVAKKLNEINGSTYSISFWRIMVMSWLSTLVQMTIERYRRIELLINKYSGQKIQVELIKKEDLKSFKTTKEFFSRGAFSIQFNHWLISRIIETHNFDNIDIKWIKSIDETLIIENKIPFRRKIIPLINNIFPSSTVYGINIKESIFWELLMKMKSRKDFSLINETNNNPFDHILLDEIDWDFLIDNTLPDEFKRISNNFSY
tara:strand:+ start:49 stop:855 length:807 start_codon:yes stop_codon:yes gene_type:complete